MATWAEIITRLRRKLRDPDGLIWADAELLVYWNEAAREIALKTGYLVRVEAHPYPPKYDYAYTHPWEREFIEGDGHQALLENQAGGNVICHPWEAAYWLEDAEPTGDAGMRTTQPWEVFYADTPADVVIVPLHEQFHKMIYLAYDQEPLDGLQEHEVAQLDNFYRQTQGKPQHYYHLDQAHNRIVIYPRPGTPVWQEPDHTDVLDDEGGIVAGSEAWLDAGDLGVAVEVIDTEGALFTVYEAMPTPLAAVADEPDGPAFLAMYTEYAALERAYGADTDGFIPSLRDFWALRKKVGIEAIKRFQRLKLRGRDYRLGQGLERVRGRGPRLPEHYPAI
jgi:hypothetical protein